MWRSYNEHLNLRLFRTSTAQRSSSSFMLLRPTVTYSTFSVQTNSSSDIRELQRNAKQELCGE